MSTAPRAAFVGEAMIELTPALDAQDTVCLGVAGDVLNAAVYFARASDKACVARFVTALGGDPFSDRIAAFVACEGLETEGIRRIAERSCGIYAVSTTDEGERSFSYWRSSSAARCLFKSHQDFEALAGCNLVLVTGITLAIIDPEARAALFDWIAAARTKGLRLAFDSNYRPALWESRDAARTWTEQFWQNCDIALPSIEDEMALFGETGSAAVLERFGRYGVDAGALKAGREGSWLLGGEPTLVPVAPADKVVDTTAAGDSFNGGYLAAAMQGHPRETCAEKAHALARKVIQHRGAVIPR